MKQRKVLQDLLIKVFCNKPEWMSKVSAKHSEKDIGFFNVLLLMMLNLYRIIQFVQIKDSKQRINLAMTDQSLNLGYYLYLV